jgi:hypothetical protein
VKLLLAVVLLGALAPPADLVVVPVGRDAHAGPYRFFTAAGPNNYAAARAAFGPPSSTRPLGRAGQTNLCLVYWTSLGLQLGFASVPHPCRATSLRRAKWYGATLTSARWRTDRGLRVGDSLARVRRLYPRARPRGDGTWTLVARPAPSGEPRPGLDVRVRNGRVSRLFVLAAYVY